MPIIDRSDAGELRGSIPVPIVAGPATGQALSVVVTGYTVWNPLPPTGQTQDDIVLLVHLNTNKIRRGLYSVTLKPGESFRFGQRGETERLTRADQQLELSCQTAPRFAPTWYVSWQEVIP